MVDTVQLNSGSGGAVLSTDEVTIATVVQHVQRVKLVDGTADGTDFIAGTAANGLDVDVTRVQGTVTVDGTAGSFPVTDSGGSLTVDNAALAVVGGGVEATALRVTVASDSTGVLSVDDNGGSLTIDGSVSVTGAVDTELTTADLDTGAGTDTRAVVGLVLAASGGGVLVGAANPVPISDNAGSLTVDGSVSLAAAIPAGTNNIGDVDVLSVVPGTGATALGKAVDDVAGATDTGVAVLAIRDDTLAALTPADGDYVPLRVNSTGALHVTGGGGGTEYAVDTALGATPTGSLAIAIRDDALSALTPVEGDAIGLRVDANGALWTIPSGTTVVSGTITANIAAGTNNIGDVDVLSIAAGDNNIGNVDIVTMPNVTLAAGTNTNEVVGDAAHDAAIAGNPVRIGARALSADYTAVAAGDTADLVATLLGKQVVYPFALPGNSWSYAAASGGIVNTTGVTAKAAAGAGIRNYVTNVQVVNGHATVSTDVQIRDGAAGTVLWRGFAQAAGGGVSAIFDPPLRGTANTLIEVACGTTGTATYFNLQGFVSAE